MSTKAEEKKASPTVADEHPKVVVVETEARNGSQTVRLTSRIWQFPESLIVATATPPVVTNKA